MSIDGGPAFMVRNPSLPGAWRFPTRDRWTDHEAATTLAMIGDAIRYGTPFNELWFPLAPHPPFGSVGGARRVYRVPRSVARIRCGLAARDYHRWHAIRRRVDDCRAALVLRTRGA